MSEKMAKIIGVITIPPLFVLLVLSWMWYNGNIEGFNRSWYLISLSLLGIVPVLAYPLSYLLPRIRTQGREGQRYLAFILSLTGYIIGVIVGETGQAPWLVRCLFWGYLFSGSTLALINQLLHYKASGHACGIAGPITFMVVITGGELWYLVLLLPLVFWARIKQDRHTLGNMLAGTMAGFLPTILVLYYFITNYH
ncbi:hypothetical protein [Syntrophomonas palmitatica]|uniref:hypothetical protein n=1 Tax=Syntrophomonas palmitatica TaxID=402877 RepID=UPI0006D21702|nr:hypothetical protein [Syntrophomonas palmitatica]